MSADGLSMYHDLVDKSWNRMVQLVGVHTVMVLVQRSVWVTSRKYQEAEFIEFDEEGVSLEKLSKAAGPEQFGLVVEEFFSSLVTILTRLVGAAITQRLAEEIDGFLKTEPPLEHDPVPPGSEVQ